MYQRILVPVDLNQLDVAKTAMERAKVLATLTGGVVRLVNVMSIVPFAYLEYVPADFDRLEQGRVEADLKKHAADLGLDEGRVSTAVRLGGVYHEVLAEAKDWKADLIVVGSHQPSMSTYLIGSNAAKIVRYATCSTLVVR